MEIDFTDQIKELRAEKNYPGKNVKRREDGVPKKKMKKRACKKGEYRDKSGKLKKTKGIEVDTPAPHPRDLSPEKLEGNPNFNKEDIEVQETELQSQPTKGLQNPRNMHEYYKNLYRKVKGLD